MPPRYFLRCLGSPELRGPGGEPVRFRTRKHLALLAFLAVERRDPHRRDRLADLLWPDARLSEGRHSLATALSVIRGKLGPRTFETTRESVRFVAADLDVDLDRLARGDVLGDETTPPLEVAGFLEEFEVSRASEYMLWRDLMRARWFPRIRDALIILMDRCRRTGDFTRIAGHADRLLAIDELSEEAIRARMEACAFAGDRITAIRVFQAWRQRLADELDAKPSALVEGMALRLRQRGYEPPGTAHIPTVPTDQWRNRAFVGRASQYRVLYERWEETNTGTGRHCLVLGESGIGKTTIAERLTTAASLEGAVSSRVQCYEVEREIPYAAIGTVVRGLLDRPGAGGTPPEWLAELALSVPAVAARFPNLPPARDSSGETARLRLTEAVHELLTALAEEQPVILVVDDVHLADDASVAVFHLLMRRTQAQRIMVVMTARQSELGNSPHAGRLLEHRGALALETVELPPLNEEEMHEVVTALAAAAAVEVPPAVRRALLLASAGVPMIVELLFDDWRTHGDECLALSVGAMTVDALGHDQQEMYHRVFERALRGLSAPARAVLNLAAILGERLNDLTMYELVDLSLAQTLAGMAELAEHRIIRDGGREVEFRNELLRGYTYLSVPSPLRRALHGLITDRLLSAEAKGEHVPGLMLAWHCFRAGRPVDAEPHLLRGCREALRRSGTFEVELALTSAMKGLSRTNSAEAKLILAEALQEQFRHPEVLRLLEDFDATEQGESMKRRLVGLRSMAAIVDSESEAREVLTSIQELMAANVSSSGRIAAIEAAQNPLYYLGDRREARAYLALIEEMEPQAVDLEDEARLGTALATCVWLARKRDKTAEVVRRVRALCSRCKSSELSNLSTLNLFIASGCLQASLGMYNEALDAFVTAHAVAVRLGNEPKMGSVAGSISVCHGRIGNYKSQLHWAEKAISLLRGAGVGWRSYPAAYNRSLALCMLGENRKAIRAIEEVSGEMATTRPAWSAQAVPLMTADIYFAGGDPAKGTRIAVDALRLRGLEPLTNGYSGTIARWVARTSLEMGSEEEATLLIARMCDDLEAHDLVDQAEILGARLDLDLACERRWETGKAILAEKLARLPRAVEHQLRRLGALS